MNCRAVHGRLLDYLDGSLSASECEAVRAHLCGCEACASAHAELVKFEADCVEHLVAPEPTYTTEDLLHRMAEVEAMEDVRALMPALPVKQGAPRFAAAALFLLTAGNLQQSLRVAGGATTQQRTVIEARQARVDAELTELGLPPEEEEGGGAVGVERV